MQKSKGILLLFVCIAVILTVGCTSQATPAPITTPVATSVATPAPTTAVPVQTSAPVAIVTTTPAAANQPNGTLTLTAAAFGGKATVNIDGAESGILTQEPPFTMKLPEGNHTLKLCIRSVCLNENIQINAAKITSLDFGTRLVNLETGSKPSATITLSQQAGHQLIVLVDFDNPTSEDLTMIATIQCVYSYGGGNSGVDQGMTAAIGVVKIDVPAGGKSFDTTTIELGDNLGQTYVSAAPTMLDFKYVKVVKNI